MMICIPVTEDRGLQSPVCAHFGSAPFFMVVDTETRTWRSIPNRNMHHGHGMCQPLASLAGVQIDGMAVGGIGAGALNKLAAADIRVFLADRETVEETVKAWQAGTLREATLDTACSQHGQGIHDGRGPHGHGHGGPGPHGRGPGGGCNG